MDIEKIKKLRDLTSLGIFDCKKALLESGGNFDKALEILKKKGIEVLEKKKGKKTLQGLVDSYVHFGGNLAALIEVNCETDFVAKTDIFKQLVKDLAMHVAAASPKYIKKEDIPQEELKDIADLADYVQKNCLFNQIFIKDSSKTIEDYLKEVISKTGENITIKRFARFSLGEDEG